MVPTHKAFVFGELLRGFRERFGISQQALGDQIGVGRNTISAWERGGMPKYRDRICLLEDELHLSEKELDLLLYAASYPLEYHSSITEAWPAAGTESLFNRQIGRQQSADHSIQPYGYLHMKGGIDDEKYFALKDATLIIGRNPAKCHLVIPDKFTRVSRVHAAITWDGTNAYIEDIGSKNYTFVDNEQVKERKPLQPGQLIFLGGWLPSATVCVLEFSLLPYPTE